MISLARGTRALAALTALSAVGCFGASDDDPAASTAGSGGAPAGGTAGAATAGTGSGAAGSGSGGTLNWPEPPSQPPAAVDLLFVIDNSISMTDKQRLLVEAMPQLVRRLITPDCVDEGGQVVGVSDAAGTCAAGAPEFAPVNDLHLGVITSSLGSHGGQVCADTATNPTLDDRARLLGSVRAGLSSWNATGFLSWDPTGQSSIPAGESNADTLIASFQDHVAAAGETGCGYEAPLEAFYRFLIDPEPPESVVVAGSVSERQGVDATVLAQRDAFLRPDSLVGVVVLSDENDCSIIDEGQGWIVGYMQNSGAAFQMPRSTSACATDPNSECCRSCGTSESGGPPEGCQPLSEDTECAKGSLTYMEDALNLRCFDQKRRFGLDLLYPVERYIQGLTSLQVPNREDELVPNPLFVTGDVVTRHSSRVFLAGAVGVPWQDLSDQASWTGSGLVYLNSAQLEAEGRWPVILGDPASGVAPSDPLMVESVDPRSGTHPLLNAAVAPSSSTNPLENPINGHEQVATTRDDLQYACIFPLAEPRDCSSFDGTGCDCHPEDIDRNRPLCQPPGGGAASTTQYFAKAYPGIRQLQLLKALGERSIVASVCPKVVTGDAVEPSYGYNPLARAVVEHAAPLLRAAP